MHSGMALPQIASFPGSEAWELDLGIALSHIPRLRGLGARPRHGFGHIPRL